MELMGDSQSTFRDMVAQLGLSGGMRPKADYTLLAPLNNAFSGRSDYCTKSAVYPLLEHESSVYVHTKWNWKSAYMFTVIPIKPLLTLQMISCPRTRGCLGSSWRTTSWRIKLSWDSCTMASIWRLLEANVWGSSSIVQYVRSQFLPRNDECHARRHAFQPHRLIDFGLNWCFYGRLCALRTPVWSGAVKREAMERFTSQKLCWSRQKSPCLRFWGRMEDLSKSTSILLKLLIYIT